MNSESSKPLNVALIGFGMAGQVFHAPLISNVKGLRLSHVVSRDPAKVLKVWPSTTVIASPDEVFSNPAVDLIAIATPNNTHMDLASRALSAGKHVVVDKPFTNTVAEAVQLLNQAAAAKRVISVFQDRRWDGDFLTLRRLLQDGALGDVTHFESHYDRYRPDVRQRWRETPGPGSGIWFDLGPHLVDQALQLFGFPEAIYADLAAQRAGGATVDYFHVILRYGKLRAILHGESHVSADLPRFMVHGTLGSFVKYGGDTQEEALKRGEMPSGQNWGLDPRDGTLSTWLDGALQSATVPTLRGDYLGYYEAVRDAIVDGALNPVTRAGALGVMTILEAAVKSSEARRELPVALERNEAAAS
ncbi:MAG: oxidoreductase [Candidatus Acidiferrales bacterium]